MNVRPRGVGDVLGNRDGYPDQAGTKKQQSGPLVLLRRGDAKPGERQDEREHLPSDGVRQECERMDVGPVYRWKSGHAPRARIDPRAPERPDERQWAVDSTVPQHASVEELLRMLPQEPGLALAVADLLPPVRGNGRPMVVPNERGRGKANLPASGLQPPADVDVVSRTQKRRIETSDGQQGVAPEGHVAARHVFGDSIVEKHVCRGARRARAGPRPRGEGWGRGR